MAKDRKKLKKKKEGNAAKYTTRNKALNRLQIKLPEFRRLCILKGVHPREPKKKFEGNQKTYYHVKDINFLAHEPLLEKSRELKVYNKKIKKARAKKNLSLAARLEANKPSYSLDHLVKERYPSFIDAVRDLDDPLTMLHLFATFPAEAAYKIPTETVNNCRRLSLEWQAYVARTHTLRKTFVSVKGIYYQAEVAGQKITWLTPHVLSQVIPDDVDIRVMLTFVEFYETLVGFVNFKLYHSLGLKYPPLLDAQLEAEAAELYAVMRDLGREADAASKRDRELSNYESKPITDGRDQANTELRLAESKARLASLQDRLSTMTKADESERPVETNNEGQTEVDEDEDEDTTQCKGLFKNLNFFLGREVPRESLLFLIRAFGGAVSWASERAPYEESDEEITHQIVDRPSQGHMFLSREYIQPQWVYDCVNNRMLLPTHEYVLGRVPPAHLSPFVDNEKEGYLPEYAETLKRLQISTDGKVLPLPGEEGLEGSDGFLGSAMENRVEGIQEVDKIQKEALIERTYREELEKEIAGVPYSESVQFRETGEDEEHVAEQTSSGVVVEDDETPSSIARAMMPRKARKLYEAMQIGNAKKRAEIELLKERKRRADGKHSIKAGKE
ncbi:hypothetical protein GOP47_0008641 [Adiantum capillus-veneris]|uniref:Pescadillo homolog n=1 Tax=Adiantum capillus-veneris TaxID=13818 RepID=A0A9D4UYS2_ADICA|nr:hypothetical protein GOP47_0008641 [Adiantum capillus-veneris]